MHLALTTQSQSLFKGAETGAGEDSKGKSRGAERPCDKRVGGDRERNSSWPLSRRRALCAGFDKGPRVEKGFEMLPTELTLDVSDVFVGEGGFDSAPVAIS